MMGAHQQGAGQPLSLQRHQPLLGLPLDICAQQHAALPIADTHHAAIVIAPATGALGPEHCKREPLPAPLLPTLAERRSLTEGIRGELVTHRHGAEQSLAIASMVPILVADDEAIDDPDPQMAQLGRITASAML